MLSIISKSDPCLLLKDTVEDEDEHALEGVEYGEQVGHDHRALVDVHQAEGPGQAQQAEQGHSPDDPGSATQQGVERVRDYGWPSTMVQKFARMHSFALPTLW